MLGILSERSLTRFFGYGRFHNNRNVRRTGFWKTMRWITEVHSFEFVNTYSASHMFLRPAGTLQSMIWTHDDFVLLSTFVNKAIDSICAKKNGKKKPWARRRGFRGHRIRIFGIFVQDPRSPSRQLWEHMMIDYLCRQPFSHKPWISPTWRVCLLLATSLE
jgi:hypothetical protein